MQRNTIIEIPQWGADSDWNEANESMAHLIHRHRANLSQVFSKAAAMRKNLETMFPLMDELCRETCVACPSPCCLTATVWIDYKDLLFIHLNGLFIPPQQLIERQPDSCRYNSPTGCTLPRLSRPWVCTLYMCPPQMAMLRSRDARIKKEFDHTVTLIKADRKIIDKLFIKMCR